MTNLYSQTSIIAAADNIAIKDGRMFRAFVPLTLAAANATTGPTFKYVLVKTPNTGITVFHGRYVDNIGAKIDMTVFSSPVFSATGTEVLTKFNMNSLRSSVTTAKIYIDPTFSSKGSENDRAILSGGTQGQLSSGSRDVIDFERILPANTYFLVEFKNSDTSNTADILYKLIWEEIND